MVAKYYFFKEEFVCKICNFL